MDLETLKTFVTLANLGNFTQTAQQHMIVQSTVSTRIKELERELGTPLFIRDRKSLRLTPAGELFLNYANKILMLEEYIFSDIHMLNSYVDSLRIGAVQTLYDCHLSTPLALYLKEHPQFSVKILLDHSKNLLNFLYDNMLDICFTYQAFQHSDYDCFAFKKDKILLVTGKSNTQFEAGISNTDLKNLRLFYSDIISSTENEWFQSVFPKHAVYSLEINVGNKLIHFLKKGLGYCFLPEGAVLDELKQGNLISIPTLDLKIPELKSYIILKKQNKHKKAVSSWIKCFIDH